MSQNICLSSLKNKKAICPGIIQQPVNAGSRRE